MKQTVSFYDFERAFKEAGRENDFSYDGLRAMFDWLEEFEEGSRKEIELDPIGLCCEFCEYESAVEAATEYGADLTDEEDALGWLSDRTSVIAFSGGVIIQSF